MEYKLINHVIKSERFFVHRMSNVNMFSSKLYNKFVLSFIHKELDTRFQLSPYLSWIGFGLGGFQLQTVTSLSKKYNFYMDTEEECKKHLDEITKKKEMVDKLLLNFSDIETLEKNLKF